MTREEIDALPKFIAVAQSKEGRTSENMTLENEPALYVTVRVDDVLALLEEGPA